MVVMEKRKDIAILKSMGAPRAAIARVFIFKGLVIGGLGTLLGNLGGYGGCWLLKHYQFIELPKDVFYVSTVPVTMYPQYFVAVTVAALADLPAGDALPRPPGGAPRAGRHPAVRVTRNSVLR